MFDVFTDTLAFIASRADLSALFSIAASTSDLFALPASAASTSDLFAFFATSAAASESATSSLFPPVTLTFGASTTGKSPAGLISAITLKFAIFIPP